MKITTINNAELVIQARDDNDYSRALSVASVIVEDSQGSVDIVSSDDTELWVHLTASWDNYQASELKDMYKSAKASI